MQAGASGGGIQETTDRSPEAGESWKGQCYSEGLELLGGGCSQEGLYWNALVVSSLDT